MDVFCDLCLGKIWYDQNYVILDCKLRTDELGKICVECFFNNEGRFWCNDDTCNCYQKACWYVSLKAGTWKVVQEEIIKLQYIFKNKYLTLEIIERLDYSKCFTVDELFRRI